MSKSSSKTIKENRIKECIAEIGSGKFRWEMIIDLSTKWRCSGRTVDRYLAIVYKMYREEAAKEQIEDILMKYDILYRQALRDGNKMLAKQILDSKGRLRHGDKIRLEGKVDLQVTVIKTTEIKKG